MSENAISTCFIHSLTGIFSVLFFLLSSASGLTALIVFRKFKETDPIYQAIGIRLKFGIAYMLAGTLLLLITIVLGVLKAGISNPKFVSSFILLAYVTSIPFLTNLKKKENYTKVAYLLISLGPLSVLNIFIGNAVFTSFHNFL